jgi:hypothetical protein
VKEAGAENEGELTEDTLTGTPHEETYATRREDCEESDSESDEKALRESDCEVTPCRNAQENALGNMCVWVVFCWCAWTFLLERGKRFYNQARICDVCTTVLDEPVCLVCVCVLCLVCAYY